MRNKWLVLIFVMVFAACSSSPTVEQTAPETPAEEPAATPEPTATFEPTEVPAPSGKIVFSSNRGENPGKFGLHVLDVESGEFSELISNLLVSFYPKWSPDGESVLYVDPAKWNMYTIQAGDGEITQLTNFRSNNGDWSPDGSQIVFQSDHDNEPQDTPDLYIIDADGENLIEILDEPEVPDFSPRWSPDGKKVLFISIRNGRLDLYTVELDNLAVEQLSDLATPIMEAVWSPDGKKIAFSQGNSSSSDIFFMDLDGTINLTQLTDDGESNLYPAWSPDGNRIVYSSKVSGNTDLWMMDADGENKVQLTDDEWVDLFPDWVQ